MFVVSSLVGGTIALTILDGDGYDNRVLVTDGRNFNDTLFCAVVCAFCAVSSGRHLSLYVDNYERITLGRVIDETKCPTQACTIPGGEEGREGMCVVVLCVCVTTRKWIS